MILPGPQEPPLARRVVYIALLKPASSKAVFAVAKSQALCFSFAKGGILH